MDYITLANLTAGIPQPHLIEALDDNGDGQADPQVVSAVLNEASRAVDGILGEKFKVPFSNPIPAVVHSAAVVFGKRIIYKRRGIHGQDNPFSAEAAKMEARLEEIAKGDRGLEPGRERPKASATAITEPAKTHSSSGKTAT